MSVAAHPVVGGSPVTVTPEMLDAMITAGLTREQIVAVTKASLAADAAAAAAKGEARRANNAERQRRFRDARKAEHNGSNALCTVTQRDGSLLNDPPALLPSVEDNLNLPPKENPLRGQKKSSRPRKIPSALPDDWQPSEPVVSRLREKGIRAHDRQAALDEMRCWAHGKDERRADWNATFEGWAIRNGQRTARPRMNGFHARSPPTEKPLTVHEVARDLEARFARPDDDEFDLLPGIRQQAH